MIVFKKKIYTEKIKITENLLDNFGNVKITQLLKDIEEIISKHADLIKTGYKNNLNKNLFWIISRSFVDIKRLPIFGEQLLVKTSVCNTSGYQSVRGVKIYSGKKVLMTIAIQYMLLDWQQKKPQKITKYYDKRPIINILDQLHFPRIRVPMQGNKCAERKVYYSDLDCNNHLNNNRYLQWVFDCLPLEIIAQDSIKSIKTEFLAEIKFNDLIEIYSQRKDNQIFIYGKDTDKIKFNVIIDLLI